MLFFKPSPCTLSAAGYLSSSYIEAWGRDSWYNENISSHHVLWSLRDWFYRWQRQNKVWGAGCWSQLIWSQSMTLLFAWSQWIDYPWDWAVACRQCLWIWQSGALSRQPAANRTECWVGFRDSDAPQHHRHCSSLNSCLCVSVTHTDGRMMRSRSAHYPT